MSLVSRARALVRGSVPLHFHTALFSSTRSRAVPRAAHQSRQSRCYAASFRTLSPDSRDLRSKSYRVIKRNFDAADPNRITLGAPETHELLSNARFTKHIIHPLYGLRIGKVSHGNNLFDARAVHIVPAVLSFDMKIARIVREMR